MKIDGVWVVHLDTPALWREEWRELEEEPFTLFPLQGGQEGGPHSLRLRLDWEDESPNRRAVEEAFLRAGCRIDAGKRHWIISGSPNALMAAVETLPEDSTDRRGPGEEDDGAGAWPATTLREAVRDAVTRATRPIPPLRAGRHLLTWDRTWVMGILNVTPDSFSDGGRYFDVERALAHAREMAAQGADILDIGAESTRPGHVPVPADEELRRLLPVVRAVASEVNLPISVDTYKAEVAEAAIREGAHIINDVWGLKRDPAMAATAARLKVPVILMHNRETPAERDAVGVMLRELQQSIALARRAGIREEDIILDPGIGFGKTYKQNLQVMRRLRDVRAMGYPVLLGTSRKSMIGRTLNVPVDQRVEGTAATVAFGVAQGVDIVRVHDVLEMVRTVRMMDAMIGRGA